MAVEVERLFLDCVEEMNQRGGRVLSIVDLLEARTLSLEMAAYILTKMQGGASVLTCAGPGGTGKTTLLAAILGLGPTKARLVPVGAGAGDLRRANNEGPVWYLCHEIGDGPYHGYLWGREVSRFLSLAQEGHFVAATVHADTMEELKAQLGQPALRVTAEELAKVDLIAFIHAVRTSIFSSLERRVVEVWESDGRQHNLRGRWLPAADKHTLSEDPAPLARESSFLGQLLARGARDYLAVRRAVASFDPASPEGESLE